ncbi:hypothetical protein L916_09973 [Phytophthora nicotianae]|uniref:Uncharacterized protein n=1 Tax=Phytophthora nicotianae TaxID=4792 RepID=W2IWF4_PHYNI|nr:hypothetical protein L916_09973 [Phytophthora nicotianae]
MSSWESSRAMSHQTVVHLVVVGIFEVGDKRTTVKTQVVIR